MLSDEAYLDSRVSQPDWFLAHSNIMDSCKSCGLAIQPGELISEIDDEFGTQFLHRKCYDWQLEDERGEQ